MIEPASALLTNDQKEKETLISDSGVTRLPTRHEGSGYSLEKSMNTLDPNHMVPLPLNKRRVVLVWIERLLLVTGGILLSVFAAAHIDGWISSHAALHQIDQERAGKAFETLTSGVPPAGNDNIDFSLWSQQRILAFRESLSLNEDRALAVIELDRLRIRAPVFEGTDDLVLNRGVGWISGTAKPGEAGNTGIAGHRDGFFRGLKDVRVGDLIELQMPQRTIAYRVGQTEIVNPEDVRVLLPRGESALTLVTCYPFYYVGHAPQRFIVHATLHWSSQPNISRAAEATSN